MIDEGHVEVLGQSGGLVEDHGLEQFDLFQPGPLEKIILEKIHQMMTHIKTPIRHLIASPSVHFNACLYFNNP